MRAIALSQRAERPVEPVATLAFRLGAWDDVVAVFGGREPADPRGLHELGFALTRRRDDAAALERGRELLGRAAEAGDLDALAALAGSWKGTDDDRALELYREVLRDDPTHPYALGNVLEFEIEAGADPAGAAVYGALDAAVGRRRRQMLAGDDLPWSAYDLGKFELLRGRPDDAVRSYLIAMHTSGAGFMLESSLASLDRLAGAMPSLAGVTVARAMVRLGLVAAHAADPATILDLATGDAAAIPEPVLVLAGASDPAADAFVASLRDPLASAAGDVGAFVSGGTTSGVSALTATVGGALGAATIGYLPGEIPDGAAADAEGYTELRRTDGVGFGPAEPVRYWADLLTSGVRPGDVRVLAVGGGALSAIEYRLALALGARVGVVRGSGREAAELLRDPLWVTDRLEELEPTAEALGRFLDGPG